MGIFRHDGVVVKLAITVVSTLVLPLHLEPTRHLALLAQHAELSAADALPQRVQMIVASALALAALVVATVLSLVKPRGLTPYGWRKELEARRAPR